MSFHYCKPWLPFGCMASDASTQAKVVFGLSGLALGIMLGLIVFAMVLVPVGRRVLDPAAVGRFERLGFQIACVGALVLSLAAAAGLIVFGAWLSAFLALGAFGLLLYAAFGLAPGRVGAGPMGATAFALVLGLAAWGFLVW